MRLGPSATRDCIQSTHNTRDEIQASSRRTRGKDQNNTNQPTASSSRRPTVEDRKSPMIMVLHPRRPPYFIGGANDDVHIWTSIVSSSLNTIEGEPLT